MTRCLMVLSVVVLLCAGVTNAAVQQGDTELDVLGGFMTQNGEDGGVDFDAWFVSAALGYFLTDNLQVQVAGMGLWSETTAFGTDVDVDAYGLGGRAKWHFMPTNQWVPYVGAQLLWTTVDVDAGTAFDDSADGTLWGPVAGVRFELNEMNDFFAEYQYQIWEGDLGDLFEDGHSIFVGIIHQFK